MALVFKVHRAYTKRRRRRISDFNLGTAASSPILAQPGGRLHPAPAASQPSQFTCTALIEPAVNPSPASPKAQTQHAPSRRLRVGFGASPTSPRCQIGVLPAAGAPSLSPAQPCLYPGRVPSGSCQACAERRQSQPAFPRSHHALPHEQQKQEPPFPSPFASPHEFWGGGRLLPPFKGTSFGGWGGGCTVHVARRIKKYAEAPTGSEQAIKPCEDKHPKIRLAPRRGVASPPRLSSHPSSLPPHGAAERETREGETGRKESEKQEKLKTHPNPFARSSRFCAGWERRIPLPHPAPGAGMKRLEKSRRELMQLVPKTVLFPG